MSMPCPTLHSILVFFWLPFSWLHEVYIYLEAQSEKLSVCVGQVTNRYKLEYVVPCYVFLTWQEHVSNMLRHIL